MIENNASPQEEAHIYKVGYIPWERKFQPKINTFFNLVWEEIKIIAKPKWALLVFIVLRFLLIVTDILQIFGLRSMGIFGGFPPFGLFYIMVTVKNSMMGITDLLLTFYVGSSTISRDRLSGAYSLYFSRQISREEYLLAKFMAVGFYLTSFTWLPAIYKYFAIGGIYNLKFSDYFKWTHLRILVYGLVYGTLIILFLTSGILLLSIYVKKGWYSAVIILPIPILSSIIYTIALYVFNIKYAPLIAGPPSYGYFILSWMLGINEQAIHQYLYIPESITSLHQIGLYGFLIIMGLTIFFIATLYIKIRKLEVQ